MISFRRQSDRWFYWVVTFHQ